jgi:hypothetical protein
MIKRKRQLSYKFGLDEYKFPDLPKKISGIQISRLLVGKSMGCIFCFPHRQETRNAKWKKYQRCWKKYRKYQYKK